MARRPRDVADPGRPESDTQACLIVGPIGNTPPDCVRGRSASGGVRDRIEGEMGRRATAGATALACLAATAVTAGTAQAATGATTIYHNVAQVPLAKDSALFWSVNREGTAAALRAAARVGAATAVEEHVMPGLVPGIHAETSRPTGEFMAAAPRGWPGLSHGCPVRRKWLQHRQPTRTGRRSQLFRIAFSAYAILQSFGGRSPNLARNRLDQPTERTRKVFARLACRGKLLFRLGFRLSGPNRTAVGQARP